MKMKYKLLLLIPFLLTTTLVTPITTHAADEVTIKKPGLFINSKGKVSMKDKEGKTRTKQSLMTEFIKKYRVIIAGVSGVGATSMILFFILGFMKLGSTSSNPEARSKVITGLILSGVAAAGLGSVTFITGVFFNAF